MGACQENWLQVAKGLYLGVVSLPYIAIEQALRWSGRDFCAQVGAFLVCYYTLLCLCHSALLLSLMRFLIFLHTVVGLLQRAECKAT